ncbi:hypothetical protein [Clostridium sp.]|uniref:hypothetical protein n=1 Tax=Clostridium sp. TaxID=1506 RepID=UPI0028FEFDB1|nr:hypothetical protein [Clostridium sp.]MDU2155952.1 hypothetical protein [Clostridium sp.]
MEDNKLLLEERDDLQQLLFLKENKERILNELDVRHDLMYKIPDNTKERRKILEMIADVTGKAENEYLKEKGLSSTLNLLLFYDDVQNKLQQKIERYQNKADFLFGKQTRLSLNVLANITNRKEIVTVSAERKNVESNLKRTKKKLKAIRTNNAYLQKYYENCNPEVMNVFVDYVKRNRLDERVFGVNKYSKLFIRDLCTKLLDTQPTHEVEKRLSIVENIVNDLNQVGNTDKQNKIKEAVNKEIESKTFVQNVVELTPVHEQEISFEEFVLNVVHDTSLSEIDKLKKIAEQQMYEQGHGNEKNLVYLELSKEEVEDTSVVNPWLDTTGRFEVDPVETYGQESFTKWCSELQAKIEELRYERDFDFTKEKLLSDSLTTQEMMLLSEHKSNVIRSVLAVNSNISDELFNKLSNDSSSFVRSMVASNVKCPTELLVKLSFDKNIAVRKNVALQDNLPKEIMETLSKDSHENVRWAIAKNAHCTKEILDTLANDTSVFVRNAVQTRNDKEKNISFPKEQSTSSLKKGLSYINDLGTKTEKSANNKAKTKEQEL